MSAEREEWDLSTVRLADALPDGQRSDLEEVLDDA